MERRTLDSGSRTGNKEREEMPLAAYVWVTGRGNAQVVRRGSAYVQLSELFSERSER